MLVCHMESPETLRGAQCRLTHEGVRSLPQHLVRNGFSHVALLTRLIVQPISLHIQYWWVAHLVHEVLHMRIVSLRHCGCSCQLETL